MLVPNARKNENQRRNVGPSKRQIRQESTRLHLETQQNRHGSFGATAQAFGALHTRNKEVNLNG